MCTARAGRRQQRRRAIVSMGSPAGLRTPDSYSPGAGTCNIMYSFERADSNQAVTLRVKDKNGRVVYQRENLGLLYLRAGTRPPFTERWDGRDLEGRFLSETLGPVTVEFTVGERAPLTRRIELRLGIRVSPDSDYKQYVNMRQGNVASHEGRNIPITATVSPPRAGQAVHFEIEADGGNRGGLAAAAQASLTHARATTDENGVARTTLSLSTYGGDKFRVSAKAAADGPVLGRTGWFTVWRRLFYEVSEMPSFDMADAAVDMVKTALERVFIQYDSAGAKHTGRAVGCFASGATAFSWADETCTNARTPLKVHYAIVGHAGDRVTETKTATVRRMQQTLSGAFRPYDFDGANWLVSGDFRARGTAGAWTSFAAGKVTLTGSNPSRQIRVDFAGSGVDPRRQAQTVRIRYRRLDPVNGWGSRTNLHVVIAKGVIEEYYTSPGAAAAARAQTVNRIMAGTSIHEPGHAMGLVYGQSWETADAAHDAHCENRRCVMWWQGYDGRPHDYHTTDPGCHTHLRGKDLSESAMRTAWRFPRS